MRERMDGTRYAMTYVIMHKPFGVLCQFTSKNQTPCLGDFDLPPHIYPVGRLDKDSEGLLLLSDDGPLIDQLLRPKHKHSRNYWVLVERIPTEASLDKMQNGLRIKDYTTRPCKVQKIQPPKIQPRVPPVRYRKNVPDCWLDVSLTEGKNRQLRRMTAAIGHPTLRLIRHKIENISLGALEPGQWKHIDKQDIFKAAKRSLPKS